MILPEESWPPDQESIAIDAIKQKMKQTMEKKKRSAYGFNKVRCVLKKAKKQSRRCLFKDELRKKRRHRIYLRKRRHALIEEYSTIIPSFEPSLVNEKETLEFHESMSLAFASIFLAKDFEKEVAPIMGNFLGLQDTIVTKMEQDPKTIRCEKCGKEFTGSTVFRLHQILHARGNTLVCKLCSKPFTYRHQFEDHILLHAGAEEKFKCKLCTKAFRTNRVLQRHMVSHKLRKRKRLYICRFCGKEYIQRDRLKVHENSMCTFLRHLKGQQKRDISSIQSKETKRNAERHDCSIKISKDLSKALNEKPSVEWLSTKGDETTKPVKSTHKVFKQCPVCHKEKCWKVPGENRLKCCACVLTFPSYITLRAHWHSHLGVQFFCFECSKPFPRRCDYNAHMRAKHFKEDRFKCKDCSKSFCTKSNLRMHIRRTHEFNGQCKVCSKEVNSYRELQWHQKQEHPELKEYVKCTMCLLSFTKLGLTKHMKNMHLVKSFGCERCSVTFAAEDELAQHMKSHESTVNNESAHTCCTCGLIYDKYTLLQKHVVEAHRNTTGFTCLFCNKVFQEKKPLVIHVYKMHRELACLYCYGLYKNKSLLFLHMKKNHSDLLESEDYKKFYERFEKVHAFEYVSCESEDGEQDGGFKAVVPRNYQTDERKNDVDAKTTQNEVVVKSKNKNHECKVCKKCFKFGSLLKKHMVIHEKGPTLKCKICKIAFFRIRHLKRHENEKHPELRERVKCSLCTVYFLKKGLRVHMKTAHQKEVNLAPDDFCSQCYQKECWKVEGEEGFRCCNCFAVFTSLANLRDHRKSHTDKLLLFTCSVCKRTFRDQTRYNDHVAMHSTGKKLFRCSECGACVANSHALKRHLQTHNEEKMYKCRFCDTKFQVDDTRQRHEVKVHPNERKEYLQAHHTGGKKIQIEGRRKKRQENLQHTRQPAKKKSQTETKKQKRQANLHHSERKKRVDKSGENKLKLGKHLKANSKSHVSTGESTNECKICSVTFVSVKRLQIHQREEHPKVTEYVKCTMCPLSFSKLGLAQHMVRMHSVKSFKCARCSATFAEEDELAQHMKSHESTVDDESTHTRENGKQDYGSKTAALRDYQTDERENDVDAKTTQNEVVEKSKKHECKECKKCFKFECLLKKHMIIHEKGPTLKCEICNIAFFRSKHLTRHEKEEHPELRERVKCSLCSVYFFKKGLMIHMKKAHQKEENLVPGDVCPKCHQKECWKVEGEEDFRCCNCFAVFTSLANLRDHRKSHPDKLFTCSVCKRTFRHQIKYDDHVAMHSKGKKLFRCSECGACVANSHALKRHLQSHNKEKMYKCRFCDAKYQVDETRQKHERKLHPNERKEYLQAHHSGDKKIRTEARRKKRQAKLQHNEDNKHTRQPAKKKSQTETKKQKRQANLHRSERNKHTGKSGEKKLKLGKSLEANSKTHVSTDEPTNECKVCSMTFVSVKHLQRHQKEEHPELTEYVKCTICSLSFSRSELTIHMQQTHPETSFDCERCGEEFVTKEELTDHMKSHVNEHTYTCCTCGLVYVKYKLMLKHVAEVHPDPDATGFTCLFCNKVFQQKKSLVIHVNKMHREHACFLCDRVYQKKDFLLSHMKKHHSDLPESEEFKTFYEQFKDADTLKPASSELKS